MGLYGKSVIAFTKSNFLIQFWIEMLTSAHSTNLSEAKAFFLYWQNLIIMVNSFVCNFFCFLQELFCHLQDFKFQKSGFLFGKTPLLELNVVTCSVLRWRQVNAKSKKLHIADGNFCHFNLFQNRKKRLQGQGSVLLWINSANQAGRHHIGSPLLQAGLRQ